MALAESARKPNEKPVLGEEHISEVVNLALSFHKYLIELNKGYNATMLAGFNRLRVAELEMAKNVGIAQSRSPLADASQWSTKSMVGPGLGFQRGESL